MTCAFYDPRYVCGRQSRRAPAAASLRASVRLLLFGTSLLRQVAEELLCALPVVSGIDLRAAHPLQNRFTTRSTAPRACSPACATHEFARYELANGAQITTVVNWPHLQRLSARRSAARFMREGNFTHILLMVPHEECFFDWLQARGAPFCINTQRPYRPEARYVRAYHAAMRASGASWWFVLPWTQRRAYGEPRALPTRPTMRNASFCAPPACGPGEYHQCAPGPVAHVSCALVRRTAVGACDAVPYTLPRLVHAGV